MPDDEIDICEMYLIQEDVARSGGWDDPGMDVYNDYGTHHKPQGLFDAAISPSEAHE